MRLAFGADVGHQGVSLEALGLPEYRAGDLDRIVKGKFMDDIDRRLVDACQPLCKLRAGGNFNLVRQSPDDLAEGPYLVITIAAGDQQIGGMPQRPHAAFGGSSQDRLVEIPQKRFYLIHFSSPKSQKTHTNDIRVEPYPRTREFSVKAADKYCR